MGKLGLRAAEYGHHNHSVGGNGGQAGSYDLNKLTVLRFLNLFLGVSLSLSFSVFFTMLQVLYAVTSGQEVQIHGCDRNKVIQKMPPGPLFTAAP